MTKTATTGSHLPSDVELAQIVEALGPFDPPPEHRFEPEFKGAPPRSIPPELYQGPYCRLQKWRSLHPIRNRRHAVALQLGADRQDMGTVPAPAPVSPVDWRGFPRLFRPDMARIRRQTRALCLRRGGDAVGGENRRFPSLPEVCQKHSSRVRVCRRVPVPRSGDRQTGCRYRQVRGPSDRHAILRAFLSGRGLRHRGLPPIEALETTNVRLAGPPILSGERREDRPPPHIGANPMAGCCRGGFLRGRLGHLRLWEVPAR